MPDFQFRLQVLLDQRAAQKQQAEEVLLQRERDLAAEKSTLEELEAKLEQAEQTLGEKRRKRVRVQSEIGALHVRRDAHLLGLRKDLQAAYSGVLAQEIFMEEAEEAVERARKLVKDRQQDYESLNKYRGKLEARWLQEAAYREELEQDEIGNIMRTSMRARA